MNWPNRSRRWFRLLGMVAIFVLFQSFLAACGSDGNKPPTAVPTADLKLLDMEIEDSSNLIEDSPRPAIVSPLPPTWTVEPQPSPTWPLRTPSAEIPGGGVETTIYVVQLGDTLGEIALRYKISVDELAAANDLQDVDQIEEGQELIIP